MLSSELHLFDLISQKTGKKERENEKEVALYSNFYQLVCFSAGALISTTEAKGYTSATAFSEAVSRQCIFCASQDCSRGVMKPKCKCGTSLEDIGLQTYSNLEHLAKNTAAGPQLVLPFLRVLALWCLFSAAS